MSSQNLPTINAMEGNNGRRYFACFASDRLKKQNMPMNQAKRNSLWSLSLSFANVFSMAAGRKTIHGKIDEIVIKWTLVAPCFKEHVEVMSYYQFPDKVRSNSQVHSEIPGRDD